MAGFTQTMTKAQMLAGNMIGYEGLILCTDDYKLYTNDGTYFIPVDGHYWAIVQVVGTNLVATTCNTLDGTANQTVALTADAVFAPQLFDLPAGVKVKTTTIESITAFNGGTSDTISVGITGSLTLFSNAINVHDAAGEETVTTAGQARRTSATTTVLANHTVVGAAPTAGKALIVVHAIKVPTA